MPRPQRPTGAASNHSSHPTRNREAGTQDKLIRFIRHTAFRLWIWGFCILSVYPARWRALQDRQGGAPVPLIRLAWNKQDPNYLGMITMDSNKCVVLDIRVPSASLPDESWEGWDHRPHALFGQGGVVV